MAPSFPSLRRRPFTKVAIGLIEFGKSIKINILIHITRVLSRDMTGAPQAALPTPRGRLA